MIDDERERLKFDRDMENLRLRKQLEESRRREKNHAKAIRFMIFLVVWLVPFAASEPGPGVPEPCIGPISIRGLWLVGVPIVVWIYCGRKYKVEDD